MWRIGFVIYLIHYGAFIGCINLIVICDIDLSFLHFIKNNESKKRKKMLIVLKVLLKDTLRLYWKCKMYVIYINVDYKKKKKIIKVYFLKI